MIVTVCAAADGGCSECFTKGGSRRSSRQTHGDSTAITVLLGWPSPASAGGTSPATGESFALVAASVARCVLGFRWWGWCGVLGCGVKPANKKGTTQVASSPTEERDFDCAFNLRALVPRIKATHRGDTTMRIVVWARSSRTFSPQELIHANVAPDYGDAEKSCGFFSVRVLRLGAPRGAMVVLVAGTRRDRPRPSRWRLPASSGTGRHWRCLPSA